jgi:hypothetical protein
MGFNSGFKGESSPPDSLCNVLNVSTFVESNTGTEVLELLVLPSEVVPEFRDILQTTPS